MWDKYSISYFYYTFNTSIFVFLKYKLAVVCTV